MARANTAPDTPNAETLEAIEEVRRMKADPTLGKGYTNVDEMVKDVLDAPTRTPKKTIQELFAGYEDGFLQSEELDWGEPQGEEVW